MTLRSLLPAILLCALAPVQAEIVYFCDDDGNTGMVDTNTMATSMVGNLSTFSIGQVIGMAYDPARDLLYILDRSGSGNVYSMDPNTGTATLLFSPGRQFQGGAVMGDDLWGIDESSQTFVAYSLTTLTMSVTGAGTMGHTHSVGIDLAANQLYAHNNSTDEIYEVSSAGVPGTVLVASAGGGIEDVDYVPSMGDFLGVAYGRDLNLIDGSTGAQSVFLTDAQLSAVGVTGSMSGVAVRQASLSVVSVDTAPTMVAPGQAGLAVSMVVENPGGNPMAINSADLDFSDSMMVDVTGDYTVTPDPMNPTMIVPMGMATFDFTVDVGNTPALGTITLDGAITATDAVSMVMVTADGAQNPDTWDVIGAVPQVLSVSTPPAMVSQGSTGHVVTVEITNVGLLDMNVTAVTLTFTGTADRTSEYTVVPDPANPSSVAVGVTEVFLFTVDVDTMATTELVVLDAGVDGTSAVSGAMVQDLDADMTDSWIVEMCLATLCGDCNGDGMISILDALTGAQHSAALITLTGVDFTNCNVIGVIEPNPGAMVDILDALTLAQAAAGLPVTLVCC